MISVINFYLLAGIILATLFILIYKITQKAFLINSLLLLMLVIVAYLLWNNRIFSDHYFLNSEFNSFFQFLSDNQIYSHSQSFIKVLIYIILPAFFLNVLLYVLLHKEKHPDTAKKYQVEFQVRGKKLVINNLKRGVSIIGSAGSGKTESVIYNLLQHFSKYTFSGIMHDYKNFELTEIAYPLFKKNNIPFYTISFDPVGYRVNPVAPRYLPNEESVNEISKVLMENLLEIKDSNYSGSSRFFNDAVEGLVGGLIWKLRSGYPQYCTLPHVIAVYQYLDTESLVAFLSSDTISRSMASAFINGVDSERQTAAVRSTLANAFKKISTQRIFMVLSKDEVPLDINSKDRQGVISIVNNPKYETAYAPVISAILHTVIKQMSVRGQSSSFILMEEAPTIRLLNMHRIPATLRSYDITTIYVMQDKIQNDLLYGDKASRAILSNLSYQFFGKVNDPDTARYYERFFEIVKRKTTSINRGFNLNFDTRITKGEKEVSKIRADVFFRLKQGEFISFADGKDKKVQFRLQKIQKQLPAPERLYSEQDLKRNFDRIHQEVRGMFG